jgi:hypothetical protein
VALAAGLLATGALARPGADPDEPTRQPQAAVRAIDDLYFPIREGMTRVYEAQARGATYQHTETVTRVEHKGAGFRVTTGQEAIPGEILKIVTDVSARGVYLVEFAGKVHADPLPLLKLPAKAGDSWTVKKQIPTGGLATFTYTVGKVEEVKVPAGTFKAIRVQESAEPVLRMTATHWYAPGVGLVKTVAFYGKSEQTQVLKSYTPRK